MACERPVLLLALSSVVFLLGEIPKCRSARVIRQDIIYPSEPLFPQFNPQGQNQNRRPIGNTRPQWNAQIVQNGDSRPQWNNQNVQNGNARPQWNNQNQVTNGGDFPNRPRVPQQQQQPITQRPVPSTTSNPICEQQCLKTAEFNPVCGNNMISYTNLSRLECARRCGLPNLMFLRYGNCPRAAPPEDQTFRK